MNLDEMTLQELKDRAEMIHTNNSHWKSSQDGSYEMALSYAGYYKLCAQIELLEKLVEGV